MMNVEVTTADVSETISPVRLTSKMASQTKKRIKMMAEERM